jgi:hypothetical protein
MAMSEVRFNRAPYTVTYRQDGETKTIRRVPPLKLHDVVPDDLVSLKRSKNADFQAGDPFTVKQINPRQPNVLQVTGEDGVSTFVDYYDIHLEEMRGTRDGVEPLDLPINNRYLLWP